MTLPKFVNREVTRHGKTIYYFRRNRGRRVPIPGEPGTEHFDRVYKRLLLDHTPIEKHSLLTPATIAASPPHKQRVVQTLLKSMKGARLRAKAKGMDFDLSADWIIQRVERNNFECELTGVEFYTGRFGLPVNRGFTPSLDRIDNSKGYTKDNVRIVLLAANIMMSDWGHAVFKAVAVNYAKKNAGAIPKHALAKLKKTPNPLYAAPNPCEIDQ